MNVIVSRLRSLHASVEAVLGTHTRLASLQQSLLSEVQGSRNSARQYSQQTDFFGQLPQLPQRRVVVTGIGIVSPLAVGTAASWDKLVQGHTAVRRLQAEDLPEVGLAVSYVNHIPQCMTATP